MSKETIDFINANATDVIKSVQGTGLFPSLKMAQMIIESSGKDANGKFGIGKGLAVRKANNYFGIKADKGWKGKSVALSTPKDGQKVNLFRVYASALDSLKDHSIFLLKNSRYKSSGVFTAKTPQDQALALQKSGYSESPTYAKALIGLIQVYHLEKLDKAETSGSGNILALTGGVLLALGTAYYYREEIKTGFKKLIA